MQSGSISIDLLNETKQKLDELNEKLNKITREMEINQGQESNKNIAKRQEDLQLQMNSFQKQQRDKLKEIEKRMKEAE